MTAAISRFPVPALESLPEDLQQRIARVQEKAGFVPNVFVALAHRPEECRAFFDYHDALMRRKGGLKGGKGNDRGGDVKRQSLLLLHHHPRRDPARGVEAALIADQVAANYLKADLTPREKAILDFAMKATLQSHQVDEQAFIPLRAHALDEEDIWDVGAIVASFALSNRMANITVMRRNDDFFTMGR